MRHLSHLLPVIATLCAAAFATPPEASAYSINLTAEGSWHSEFSGTNTSGVKFFFHWEREENYENRTYTVTDATVTGIEAPAGVTDVTLPDQVVFPSTVGEYTVANPTYTVTKAGRPNDHGMEVGNGIKNITIPATYTVCHVWTGNYENVGRDVETLTFQPLTPPNVSLYERPVFVIVDPTNIAAYRAKCDSEEDGWNNRNDFVIPTGAREATVEIATEAPDRLLNTLKEKVTDLRDVCNLKVTGQISSSDMLVFKELKNLITLDLSATTMVTEREDKFIRGCGGLQMLERVTLPECITTIDNEAFSDCPRLKYVNLENITRIGGYAFSYDDVSAMDFSNVESIGYRSFLFCKTAISITLPKLTSMEAYAFGGCENLETFSAPLIKSIPPAAFHSCFNLRSVEFSDDIIGVGGEAFQHTCLTEFTIPKGCSVGDNPFTGSKIETIHFHDNSIIDNRSFSGMEHLVNLYCYDPFPHEGKLEISSINTILYVPEFVLSNYSKNEDYNNFATKLPLPSDLDYIEIREPLTIDNTKGIATGADFVLNDTYQSYVRNAIDFINNSNGELNLGNFTQNATFSPVRFNDFNLSAEKTSSFISDGKVTANAITVNLDLNDYSGNTWNFIALPYNVNVNDIRTPTDALWVVRRYDGKIRAERTDAATQPAWQNVSNDEVMECGKGYILSYTHTSGDSRTFSFPWNLDGTPTGLSNGDVTIPLEYWPVSDPQLKHNESWNLIGNPYNSFFNCRGNIEFEGPITVMTSDRTYLSFSLVDDDYILRPFEAFFVQKRDATSDITFRKEGRCTYSAFDDLPKHAPAVSSGSGTRAIFNLYAKNDAGSDRTRIVVNEEAEAAYELSCDAAKFFGEGDAPQLFTTGDDVSYSINERPLGDGTFPVGLSVSAEGLVTISADSRNADDYTAIMTDNLTGHAFNPMEEECTVFASGSDNARFTLTIRRTNVGIDETDDLAEPRPEITVNGNTLTVTADGEISIFTTDGRTVAAGRGTLTIDNADGLYVVKTGRHASKVMTGK